MTIQYIQKLKIGNRTLVYNQNNRLVRVEEDSTILGEYTYNGLGQRVTKEVDGTTTIFHYDFDGNIIGESGIGGTFSKEYLYKGSSRLALVDVASEEIYFYGNDKLGTPIILTDSTNTVIWEAVYKPFGEAEVNPNSEVVNNFRFAGQYYDEETGFHYNYHRYYEPSTGRYLTPDPIGQLGGLNLFIYAENKPINDTDPLGLVADGGVISVPTSLIVATAGVIVYTFAPQEVKIQMAKDVKRLWEWITGDGGDDDNDFCEFSDEIPSPPTPGMEPDDPNDRDLTDKVQKIANRLGYSRSEIEKAIHSVKRSGLPRGQGNPNVYVNLKTGEVYPKTTQGFGDSIGNIFDFLK